MQMLAMSIWGKISTAVRHFVSLCCFLIGSDHPVITNCSEVVFEILLSEAPCVSFLSSGKSKEAEIKRINKELANIRSKFKGDKALDGYSKKKYVCKLLFIFLLGHDIDFGHMEAVNLLSSNKYTEKQIVSGTSSNILLCVDVWIKF